MTKLIALLVVVVGVSSSAVAEPSLPPASAAPTNLVGVDGSAVVPVGDYGRVATIGVGALARVEIPLATGFVFGRAGAIFHGANGNATANLTVVPLYVGYRQPISDRGAYVAGELGLSIFFGTVRTPFGMTTGSDSELGAMLSVGVRRGNLDLRGGLFLPDADDAVGVMASAGYDFARF